MATEVRLQANQNAFKAAAGAAGQYRNSLARALPLQSKLTASTIDSVKELISLKTVLGGIAGVFGLAGWRQGLETMGRLQEQGIAAARTFGMMEDTGRITSEVVKGANSLGIEYERMGAAMQQAGRFKAQMQLTQKEFLAATQQAAAFGEATGMGAERGAEMMSKLIGIARLTPDEVKVIQNEFLALQRSIGMTADEMGALSDALVPVLDQLKIMGATTAEIRGLAESTSRMTLQFAAMGKSAGEAGQFIDKMLDPSRINENMMLWSQLGISASDAIAAIEGGGTSDFIDRLGEKLPDLGRQIQAMGAQAGEVYAQTLGLTYREALSFTKMDSEEAKKRAKELQKKQAEEKAFQKQLDQTLKTWQRYFVGLTQAFDAMRMRFASVLGGDTFTKFQDTILNIAHTIIDILAAADVRTVILTFLRGVNKFLKVFKSFALPIAKGFAEAFKEINWDNIINKVAKIATEVGSWIGEFIGDNLPKLAKGLEKILSGIIKISDKLGTGGTLTALAGLFAGGKIASGAVSGTGLGGAIFGPVLSKMTGGMLGSKAGLSSQNPLYVKDVSKGGDLGGLGQMLNFIPGGKKIKALGRLGRMKMSAGLGGLTGKLPAGLGAKSLGIGKGLLGKAGPIALVVMGVIDGIRGAIDDEGINKLFDKEGEKAKITAKERFGAGIASSIDGLLLGLLPDELKRRVAVVAAETADGAASAGPAATAGAVFGMTKGLIKSTTAYKEAVKGNTFELYKNAEKQKIVREYLNGFGASAAKAANNQEQFNSSIGKAIEIQSGLQHSMQGMTKEQYAFNEGLMKGKYLGFSLNDLGDAIDKTLTTMTIWDNKLNKKIKEFLNNISNFITETKNQWIANVKNFLNSLSGKLFDFFDQTTGEMISSLKNKIIDIAKNIEEKIKFMFDYKRILNALKGVFTSVGNYITNAVKNAMASMSDGMLRTMYRVVQAMETMVNGVVSLFGGEEVDWGKDFSRYANQLMHDRYMSEVKDLETRVQKARAQGSEVFNPQVESFTKELEDLNKRFHNQAQFVKTYDNNEHAFTAYQRQAIANLNEIAEATKQGAGAGARTADNTERIARNTERPKKFIDIDALAIRANESRNVYMTYQTVPDGNT